MGVAAHYPGPSAWWAATRDIAYIGMRAAPLPSCEERWELYKRMCAERRYAELSLPARPSEEGEERP